MLLLALAAAAQLSAPQPKNVWFNKNDTPYGNFAGSSVTVSVRVNVTPNGRVKSCTVEESSRWPPVDRYTCTLIVRRARFAPARSQSGQPMYGAYRLPVTWAIHDSVKPRPRPDLQLTVDGLPQGVRSPASVRLMFAVDESGRPSSCAAEPSTDIPKANLQLVPTACEEFVKTYTAVPARDSAGKPVPSIQDGSVEFTQRR